MSLYRMCSLQNVFSTAPSHCTGDTHRSEHPSHCTHILTPPPQTHTVHHVKTSSSSFRLSLRLAPTTNTAIAPQAKIVTEVSLGRPKAVSHMEL